VIGPLPSTHRDALKTGPTRGLPSYEWEFSNPGFNGQNAGKTGVIAIDSGPAEIWLGPSLVNAALPTPQGPSRLLPEDAGGRIYRCATRPCKAAVERFRDLGQFGSGVGRRQFRGWAPCCDFIILTDFSRCQGHAIGRVSRRFAQQPAGFEDKDFS
jgi:hypothetical protein